MNYHLGAPQMPAQNAHPAGLNVPGVSPGFFLLSSRSLTRYSTQYTCHDLPMSNGTTQNMFAPAVVYGINRILCHGEENSQTNSWPVQAISHDGPQLEAQHIPQAQHIASNNAMLHAPVPLSGQQPLTFSGALHYNYPELEPQPLSAEESGFSALQGYHPPQLTMSSETTSGASDAHYPQGTGLNELPTDSPPYYQNEAPTRTFPTPSELLIELTNANSAGGAMHCDSNRNLDDSSRRSRRRLVSRNLGMIPGDSSVFVLFFLGGRVDLMTSEPRVARETISSHEKKRQYLECLEYYVMFLHQQLNLVGANPVPLERVQQYRGLNNRSIRVLLTGPTLVPSLTSTTDVIGSYGTRNGEI